MDMAVPVYYTADMVRGLPKDGYLKDRDIGEVLSSPADISWSPDTLVQPDVFVADLSEVRALEWSQVKQLLLAVEVLSPKTARYDRFTKRRLYQDIRVPVYWIVDPDQELVEVWTPDDVQPATYKDRVVWSPDGTHEPLTIELAELFEPIF